MTWYERSIMERLSFSQARMQRAAPLCEKLRRWIRVKNEYGCTFGGIFGFHLLQLITPSTDSENVEAKDQNNSDWPRPSNCQALLYEKLPWIADRKLLQLRNTDQCQWTLTNCHAKWKPYFNNIKECCRLLCTDVVDWHKVKVCAVVWWARIAHLFWKSWMLQLWVKTIQSATSQSFVLSVTKWWLSESDGTQW